MPEGPEVKRCSEVIKSCIDRRDLHEVRLVSGKIARTGVTNLDKLKFPTKVVRVSTLGKVIFIELQGDYSIISTLGMTGWWYPPSSTISKDDLSEAYYARVIKTIEQAEKYTRLQLLTEDGSVSYIDPRNFGNFYVVTQSELEKRRASLGVDFLNGGTSSDLTSSRKINKLRLGEALLEQSWIAGVGNIYRAEIMYLTGISPHRTVESLSPEELQKLFETTKLVLEIAYSGRGTMIYPIDVLLKYLSPPLRDTLLERISLQDVQAVGRHLVYGWNLDIVKNQIITEKIGGRTCWWVPSAQS